VPSLDFKTTRVFDETVMAIRDGFRTLVEQGGTGSSKTWSILQVLILMAWYATEDLLISVVSESIPHLKRGALRDFERMMSPIWDEARFNRTERIYEFDKAKIEFFGADDSSKLRGGRRDILFINEANNIDKMARDELEVRTRKFEVLDFNPVSEFWAHSLVGKPGVKFIKSTYMDARHVLPPEIVRSIESRKDSDPNWWRVYGLGEIGNIEGLVHPLFTQIDEMPDFSRTGGIEFYGLDFGYTNDPTVLIHNVIVGDNLYSDQVIFQRGLMNNQISDLMEQNGLRKGWDEIIADCAEPKSIDEIYTYGWNIKPCDKGADSIIYGIQCVNQFKQHWTKRSLEAIKEQRNYGYVKDKDGRVTNKPIDTWDHAMEARRQSVFTKVGKLRKGIDYSKFTEM
jgi:phage terminase large subunit